MKTILRFVILMAIFTSMLLVFSQDDTHECPHSGATIANLQGCVNHAAEMGHIDNQGIVSALQAKLNAAQSALNRGQTNVTVSNLNAFINLVQAQSGKHIESQHASHMIQHARDVIAAIS